MTETSKSKRARYLRYVKLGGRWWRPVRYEELGITRKEACNRCVLLDKPDLCAEAPCTNSERRDGKAVYFCKGGGTSKVSIVAEDCASGERFLFQSISSCARALRTHVSVISAAHTDGRITGRNTNRNFRITKATPQDIKELPYADENVVSLGIVRRKPMTLVTERGRYRLQTLNPAQGMQWDGTYEGAQKIVTSLLLPPDKFELVWRAEPVSANPSSPSEAVLSFKLHTSAGTVQVQPGHMVIITSDGRPFTAPQELIEMLYTMIEQVPE